MSGDLAARRQLAEYITEPAVVKKLVEQIAPALKGRTGGYTRITKTRVRSGDAAELSLIELLPKTNSVSGVILSLPVERGQRRRRAHRITMTAYESKRARSTPRSSASSRAGTHDGETLEERAFNDLALRLFAHQLRYNEPYARYCARARRHARRRNRGKQFPPFRLPHLKRRRLRRSIRPRAASALRPAGRRVERRGATTWKRRCSTTPRCWPDSIASCLPTAARLRYFNLVPNPAERAALLARLHDGPRRTGARRRSDRLVPARRRAAVRCASKPTCARRSRRISPSASRRPPSRSCTCSTRWTNEASTSRCRTGRASWRPAALKDARGPSGAKTLRAHAEPVGYRRERDRRRIRHDRADLAVLRRVTGTRVRIAPPWLRARVVGPDRTTLADGTIGSLLHVDLANRSSCIAIQTEDLGVRTTTVSCCSGGSRRESSRLLARCRRAARCERRYIALRRDVINPLFSPLVDKAAAKTRVLDLHAAIDDDVQPGRVGERDRLVVDDAVLKPNRLSTGCNRLVHDGDQFARPAKDVDEIGRAARRGVRRQRRKGFRRRRSRRASG